MKTAVIYARVSSTTDRQDTKRQVSDLTTYASANGYAIANVYEEHISGAKKNAERPVLCDCIADCIAHKHTLLLSELSRLGRNVFEVQENVKKLLENGVNAYFQKEQMSIFDVDGKETPCLAIMIAVLGTCAQMEREAIAYRLNSGRANYIANGGKLGRNKGSIKTKETKSEEYAKVLRALRKGKNTLSSIAAECNVSLSTVKRLKKEFGL